MNEQDLRVIARAFVDGVEFDFALLDRAVDTMRERSKLADQLYPGMNQFWNSKLTEDELRKFVRVILAGSTINGAH